MSAETDEAFVAFVGGAQRELWTLAWLLTGDRHRAEDLVQDTVARTYAAWHRVRREDPMAYARRVLVNAKTDTWRRRRRELLVAEVPDVSRPVASSDVAGEVVRRREVVAALRTLADRERAVVVLRYYVDFSEADTASALGISLGTVKSTASRALSKLRASPTGPQLHQDAAEAATTVVEPGGTR
jgi:RNA polymerase sigma-70 factor (sigma-E family)